MAKGRPTRLWACALGHKTDEEGEKCEECGGGLGLLPVTVDGHAYEGAGGENP